MNTNKSLLEENAESVVSHCSSSRSRLSSTAVVTPVPEQLLLSSVSESSRNNNNNNTTGSNRQMLNNHNRTMMSNNHNTSIPNSNPVINSAPDLMNVTAAIMTTMMHTPVTMHLGSSISSNQCDNNSSISNGFVNTSSRRSQQRDMIDVSNHHSDSNINLSNPPPPPPGGGRTTITTTTPQSDPDYELQMIRRKNRTRRLPRQIKITNQQQQRQLQQQNHHQQQNHRTRNQSNHTSNSGSTNERIDMCSNAATASSQSTRTSRMLSTPVNIAYNWHDSVSQI